MGDLHGGFSECIVDFGVHGGYTPPFQGLRFQVMGLYYLLGRRFGMGYKKMHQKLAWNPQKKHDFERADMGFHVNLWRVMLTK